MNTEESKNNLNAPVTGTSPATPPPSSITPQGMPTEDQIMTAIRPIQDPEIHLGILDLGLIYGVQSEPNGTVRVRMTLTSPACPVGPLLQAQVHGALLKLPGVKEVKVDLVWDPPWDPRTMATDEIKMELGLL
jgi:metal-sulfur cluster biosynthetic enzyme